jgi:hypothetical protein
MSSASGRLSPAAGGESACRERCRLNRSASYESTALFGATTMTSTHLMPFIRWRRSQRIGEVQI